MPRSLEFQESAPAVDPVEWVKARVCAVLGMEDTSIRRTATIGPALEPAPTVLFGHSIPNAPHHAMNRTVPREVLAGTLRSYAQMNYLSTREDIEAFAIILAIAARELLLLQETE